LFPEPFDWSNVKDIQALNMLVQFIASLSERRCQQYVVKYGLTGPPRRFKKPTQSELPAESKGDGGLSDDNVDESDNEDSNNDDDEAGASRQSGHDCGNDTGDGEQESSGQNECMRDINVNDQRESQKPRRYQTLRSNNGASTAVTAGVASVTTTTTTTTTSCVDNMDEQNEDDTRHMTILQTTSENSDNAQNVKDDEAIQPETPTVHSKAKSRKKKVRSD
jgi:hypothetical protein